MENPSVLCEECEISVALFQCLECEQKLCQTCDEQIHRGGKRRSHVRISLCFVCKKISTQYCYTCLQNLCNSCAHAYSDHNLQKIRTQNTAAVYWDLNCNRVITGEEIHATFKSIEKIYEKVELVKVYGQGYYKLKPIFDKYQVEYSHPDGLRESEAMLIDISLLNKESITKILVISSKANYLKVHLTQIQSGLARVQILVSLTFPSLQTVTVSELQIENKNFLVPPKSLNRPSSNDHSMQDKSVYDQFPVYQTFVRRKGQTFAHDHLLTYLKELADNGLIMHDSGWLSKNFAQKSRISIEQANNVIRELEKLGHLHISERTFGDLKTMFFTSLKLESLSLECLLWTLRSLKVDEMLPTERAVQSRMKEVFDYKVSQSDWTRLLEICKGMYKHSHTKSAPEQVKTNYSLFSSQQSLFSNSNPVFIVKEILDPVTGLKVHVIYPKDEEWESKDQHIKEGDSLGVKGTRDWQAYVDFLEEYFRDCRPGDDSRAIPGGRYGCAQFLKLCGSQPLRECSLGKLSYMVQLSIDEDLLRYHRTLLIWVPASHKSFSDSEKNAKIAVVQHTITEILKESREGMSLAQLPLYIKRKLSFTLDLAELGFAKLKDLLLTMPEVEIELRGTNHPFAVCRSKHKKHKEEEIRQALTQILNEYVKPIPGQKLETMISSKVGYFINWGEYSCANIYEFVQKRTETFQVIGHGECKSIAKVSFPQTQEEFSINILSEPLEEIQEELKSFNKLGYSKNKNPYAIEDYFGAFNPPGFN